MSALYPNGFLVDHPPLRTRGQVDFELRARAFVELPDRRRCSSCDAPYRADETSICPVCHVDQGSSS
jgi:hypothetical protein